MKKSRILDGGRIDLREDKFLEDAWAYCEKRGISIYSAKPNGKVGVIYWKTLETALKGKKEGKYEKF